MLRFGHVQNVRHSAAWGNAPALERRGVPHSIASYICMIYDGCATSIACGDASVNIDLRRGVKQGDPLSPFLFNPVVDPLLDFLHSREKGIMLN